MGAREIRFKLFDLIIGIELYHGLGAREMRIKLFDLMTFLERQGSTTWSGSKRNRSNVI